MTKAAVSHFLKSRGLILILLCGNVALGLTTMAQSEIIQGQKQLIRLLFQDSTELANVKIAAIVAKSKKH